MKNSTTLQNAEKAESKMSMFSQVDFKNSVHDLCMKLKQDHKLTKTELKALIECQMERCLTNMVD